MRSEDMGRGEGLAGDSVGGAAGGLAGADADGMGTGRTGANGAGAEGVNGERGGVDGAGRATLLWVDLEMTGLSPEEDRILEVAGIATGWDLEPVATYTGVVKVDEELMRRRMVGEFWEKHEGVLEALMAQNAEGRAVEVIEGELMEFIDRYFGEEVYLAGNSIHQDRKFIDREWPRLGERLHYRMLDVSAWKVYFEGALGKKFTKPEMHRALDDIEGSIGELKYYLGFLKEE